MLASGLTTPDRSLYYTITIDHFFMHQITQLGLIDESDIFMHIAPSQQLLAQTPPQHAALFDRY